MSHFLISCFIFASIISCKQRTNANLLDVQTGEGKNLYWLVGPENNAIVCRGQCSGAIADKTPEVRQGMCSIAMASAPATLLKGEQGDLILKALRSLKLYQTEDTKMLATLEGIFNQNVSSDSPPQGFETDAKSEIPGFKEVTGKNVDPQCLNNANIRGQVALPSEKYTTPVYSTAICKAAVTCDGTGLVDFSDLNRDEVRFISVAVPSYAVSGGDQQQIEEAKNRLKKLDPLVQKTEYASADIFRPLAKIECKLKNPVCVSETLPSIEVLRRNVIFGGFYKPFTNEKSETNPYGRDPSSFDYKIGYDPLINPAAADTVASYISQDLKKLPPSKKIFCYFLVDKTQKFTVTEGKFESKRSTNSTAAVAIDRGWLSSTTEFASASSTHTSNVYSFKINTFYGTSSSFALEKQGDIKGENVLDTKMSLYQETLKEYLKGNARDDVLKGFYCSQSRLPADKLNEYLTFEY